MNRTNSPRYSFSSLVLLVIIACSLAVTSNCSKPAPPQPKPAPSRPSDINVEVRDGGPIVVTTTAAQFQILPSGFLQATLVKDGKRFTLDEPPVGSTGGSDSIILNGKEVDFVPDFSQAKVTEATGKLGRGKRVEIAGRPLAPAGINIERHLILEAYDDFPGIALVSSTYKNIGTTEIPVDQVWMQQHRFNAALADPKAKPYDMWSFQGSSYDWGKDDVQKLTRVSSQPNLMGEAVKGGYGGGIPVVAVWTATVGEAIGHVESLPWTLSIPVKVTQTAASMPVSRFRSKPHLGPATPIPPRAASSPSIAEISTSPCASGRASCKKKAGTSPNPRTRPTTSPGVVGDTSSTLLPRKCSAPSPS